MYRGFLLGTSLSTVFLEEETRMVYPTGSHERYIAPSSFNVKNSPKKTQPIPTSLDPITKV